MAVVREENAGETWPAISLADATARLCAPGAPFEMDLVSLQGVPTRTWKNQPPNLPALARAARAQFANSTFIVLEDERISYEAWFRATAAMAREFQRCGVHKGDRVALAMRNLPEWLVVFFAATSLGAIVVPLNAWWTGPELNYGLKHSGSSLLVCDAQRWQRISAYLAELPELLNILVARSADCELSAPVRPLESVIGAANDYEALPNGDLPLTPIAPDDDATIFYTSGTTGLPKGALGSHRNMLTCTLSGLFAVHRAALRRGEPAPASQPKTTLLGIPLFHVTASHAVLMPKLMTGGKLVLMRKWDALKGLEIIERERVTTAGGVPTIAWQLIQHPERERFDLSSLESVAYGGAPSAPDLVRRVQEDLKAAPNNGWGMTETSATVTSHGAEDYAHRPTSCGPPVAVADLKIMSEYADIALPPGEVGELWAAGPQIVKGYWRDPAATSATFLNGWVRTGDLAWLDEEGFCYIVDRAKDVIIRGGENIYSSEVENVLYDHPAITDAALIGIPHATLGEVPAAVVHLGPGMSATEAELQDWVRSRIAAFKAPVRIIFSTETLPRNAAGKIMKKDLRALFHAPSATP